MHRHHRVRGANHRAERSGSGETRTRRGRGRKGGVSVQATNWDKQNAKGSNPLWRHQKRLSLHTHVLLTHTRTRKTLQFTSRSPRCATAAVTPTPAGRTGRYRGRQGRDNEKGRRSRPHRTEAARPVRALGAERWRRKTEINKNAKERELRETSLKASVAGSAVARAHGKRGARRVQGGVQGRNMRHCDKQRLPNA